MHMGKGGITARGKQPPARMHAHVHHPAISFFSPKGSSGKLDLQTDFPRSWKPAKGRIHSFLLWASKNGPSRSYSNLCVMEDLLQTHHTLPGI